MDNDEKTRPSIRWRLSVLLIASLMPLTIFLSHWQDGHGLLTLPHFGALFQKDHVQTLQAINPPVLSPYGYDGQFYAQIALDPLLSDADTALALDNPNYRARRIGLPLLATFLGTGEPERVLFAYSLLNFGFWLLLTTLLVFVYLEKSIRSLLVLMAILWTSGAVTSLDRALTDLPAAVVGLLAVHLASQGKTGVWLMACSTLIKDTSMLSIAAFWPRLQRSQWRQRILISAFLILPVVLWAVYVQWRIPTGPSAGTGNFSIPFAAWLEKIRLSTTLLANAWNDEHFVYWPRHLIELLAPLSLAAQALYLLSRWRINDPIWGFGAGFAALVFLIGPSVWAEFMAYTRVLLPLTIAFNILLLKYQTEKAFWAWFAAGNIGMGGGFLLVL